MNKKLRPLNERKPQVVNTVEDMAKWISADTGFRADDILIVFRSAAKYIKSRVKKGFGVNFPKVGIFYPLIKPARTVMSMNGGIGEPTKMKMESRWQLKFSPSRRIDNELKEIKVSQEEYDNLYK